MVKYKSKTEAPTYNHKKGEVIKIIVTPTSRKIYTYFVRGYSKDGFVHLVRYDEKLKMEIKDKIPKARLGKVFHGVYHKTATGFFQGINEFRQKLAIVEHSYNKKYGE